MLNDLLVVVFASLSSPLLLSDRYHTVTPTPIAVIEKLPAAIKLLVKLDRSMFDLALSARTCDLLHSLYL